MNATRSRRLAAVAAVLIVPAISACSVSFDAQTDKVYTPAEGVNDRSGDMDVLNAMIVSAEDGSGRLIAGLSNNNTDEDDALAGVAGAGAAPTVSFALTGGSTTVTAGGYLQLADEGAAAILATGDDVVAGNFVRITMSFARADSVTMNVPVIEAVGPYADVEIPSAAPSEKP